MQYLSLDLTFNAYEIYNIYQFYVHADSGFSKIYSLIKNRKYILLNNWDSLISFNE